MEHFISDSDSIVATADLQGNITHVNPYFIEVSDFTEEELIDTPQNITRYSEMLMKAYIDL
ncbi:hypothetical protein [Undibacterium sp. Di24W]|uniref:hypothetical protein n=1 Tax=Undibacterium sp. Di24W TaxID=3413033 RepID=UPI003BF09012